MARGIIDALASCFDGALCSLGVFVFEKMLLLMMSEASRNKDCIIKK
jgi:hypothetical protein